MTMKALIALLVLFCMTASGALAAGNGKPKICFTPAEENAEQLVRGGLRLREGAAGCDRRPWDAGTLKLWQQVDQNFGPRFKQQTDIRRRAFEREFSKDVENQVRLWDGRTVLYFRNFPLSVAYCAEIKKTLETMLKSGWSVLVEHAQRAHEEVEMDYRPCS